MRSKAREPTGSQASVWDQEAAVYDASHLTDPVYASCMYQSVAAVGKGTARCLDAGCGTGLSTMPLALQCDTVIAADYSYESLKVLESKRLPNVLLVQADLTALPFKDSAFDACVCTNVLQHLRPGGAQELATAELQRVTKDNGVLSISVHHYSLSKQRAGWVKEGKPGQPGIDYIFRFSPAELQALVPGAEIRGVGYYRAMRVPYFGRRTQDWLARKLGQRAAVLGHGHMLVAVAKKQCGCSVPSGAGR